MKFNKKLLEFNYLKFVDGSASLDQNELNHIEAQQKKSIAKVAKNKTKLTLQLDKAEAHLNELKTQVLALIDAGYHNSLGFSKGFPSEDKYNKKYKKEDDPLNYNSMIKNMTEIKPSEFLEKAYTLSLPGQNNREQIYIDAGVAFNKYCENKENSLNTYERVLQDAGGIISIINTDLSNIAHAKKFLQDGYHESALQKITLITKSTKTREDITSNSKIFQADIPRPTVNTGFFSSWGRRSPVTLDLGEVYQEKINDIKKAHKIITEATDSDHDDEQSSPPSP